MILPGFFTSTTIVPAVYTDVFFLAIGKNANQSSILKYIEYIVNIDDDDYELDSVTQKRMVLFNDDLTFTDRMLLT